MRKFVLLTVGFVLTLSACQSAQVYLDAREKANTSLMEQEADLLATYFQTREFHGKLIMECPNPDKEPYPQLTSSLDTMLDKMTLIQERRGSFYTESTFLGERQSRMTKKELNTKLNELAEGEERCQQAFEVDEKAFFEAYAAYDSTRNAHGITYISHADYADSLLTRMMIWEDSLEIQGGRIAKALQLLKQVVPDQKSQEYKNFYRPISEMQFLHKEMQSHLTGAENAMNRYQVAPQDEGYFTGPHLTERHDVDATEELFVQMRQNMNAFRQQESLFMSYVRR